MLGEFESIVWRFARQFLRKDSIWQFARRVFSRRTVRLMRFDLVRADARFRRRDDSDVGVKERKLHLGCGSRRVRTWLNVDVEGSDYDIDLAAGRLPFADDAFESVVSQHVIEHLELETEVIPLLKEVRRVSNTGAELWLSCPDIEKICRSYLANRMVDLLEDRQKRWEDYSLNGIPPSHMINDFFHQKGEHRNLMDEDLLVWALEQAGFERVERVVEGDLLERYPEMPARGDDQQSVYVRAYVGQKTRLH